LLLLVSPSLLFPEAYETLGHFLALNCKFLLQSFTTFQRIPLIQIKAQRMWTRSRDLSILCAFCTWQSINHFPVFTNCRRMKNRREEYCLVEILHFLIWRSSYVWGFLIHQILKETRCYVRWNIQQETGLIVDLSLWMSNCSVEITLCCFLCNCTDQYSEKELCQ
jgi:hypothetical protein